MIKAKSFQARYLKHPVISQLQELLAMMTDLWHVPRDTLDIPYVPYVKFASLALSNEGVSTVEPSSINEQEVNLAIIDKEEDEGQGTGAMASDTLSIP